MASLRVWDDKPYRSPQIIIAPDVELVVKTIRISSQGDVYISGKELTYNEICDLANNDGLSIREFTDWFSELPFAGQLLIWNNKNLPY